MHLQKITLHHEMVILIDKVKAMKKLKVILRIIMIVLSVAVCTACSKDKKNIIEADSEEMASGSAMLESSSVKSGTLELRVKDAYITENLKAAGLQSDKVVAYSNLELVNEDGEIQCLTEPDFFENADTGELKDGCSMYVVQLEVTNIDAISQAAEYQDNDFLFRADDLRLCYVENDMILAEKNISYYSLKSDGNHTWSTYELKPGETITYEVGYFVGNVIKQSARSDTRDLIKNPITKIDENNFCLTANITNDNLLKPEWRHE